MNDKRLHALPSMGSPIAEADLHAYADGCCAPSGGRDLPGRASAGPRPRGQAQRQALRSLLDPVLDEPLPLRLPLAPPARAWLARAGRRHRSGGVQRRRGLDRAASWTTTGSARRWPPRPRRPSAAASYAQRAAVAHAVYAPDMGRPVEVGGDNEKALVTWLTKRLGAPSARPRCPRWAMSWSAAACCPAAPARWRCSCTARPTGSA